METAQRENRANVLCHLLFDVTAGPATRKHSGAAIAGVAALPPSLYRASSPTITVTGRQPPIRASPSLAGRTWLSHPGDVAGPSPSPGASRASQSTEVCRPWVVSDQWGVYLSSILRRRIRAVFTVSPL